MLFACQHRNRRWPLFHAQGMSLISKGLHSNGHRAVPDWLSLPHRKYMKKHGLGSYPNPCESGAYRTQTGNPDVANVVLYQLS